MAEQCPLPITVGSIEANPDGFFWDTGIPFECWSCINAALGSKAAEIEFFELELDEGEDLETLDKYTVHGLKRSDNSGARTAVQECGIDDFGENEGPLLSRTEVDFTCRHVDIVREVIAGYKNEGNTH